MTVESRELPMSPTPSRFVPRSLVCSTLAVVLAAAPSLPVLAAAPSKSKSKKAKVEETEAPKAEEEAAPPPAEVPASPEGDSEALSAAAVERFEAKDYDGAVELFEQAYVADPNPNFLFNIGRVYEEKGDLENAVVYYQKFVGQSGVDLESRQAATERLKVLREALAQMKGEEKNPPEDTAKPEDTTEPPVDQPPADTGEDDKAAKRKKTLRITGYSLMGVGGVGLIVGAVFGGLAQGSVKDADADPFIDRQQAFRERATTQAHVADAMFITGGVLAAAGLVLVLTTLGGKKAKGNADVAKTVWSPVVGPQRVGLSLRF